MKNKRTMITIAAAESKEEKEIMKYLSSRYGTEEFQLQQAKEGDKVSYQVSPNAAPDLVFTVEEGKLEDFHDAS